MTREANLGAWEAEFDPAAHLQQAAMGFCTTNNFFINGAKTFEARPKDNDGNRGYMSFVDGELHTLVISCKPRGYIGEVVGYAFSCADDEFRCLILRRGSATSADDESTPTVEQATDFAASFLGKSNMFGRNGFSPEVSSLKDVKKRRSRESLGDLSLKFGLLAIRLLEGATAARIHRWDKPENQ